MTKKILIVEDGEQHRKDAQEYFNGLEGQTELVFATYFGSAHSSIYAHQTGEQHFDGAIVDIYMPQSRPKEIDPRMPPMVAEHFRGMSENLEPCGVGLAALLEKLKVPFVLNTAGYHHGTKYEWIHNTCGDLNWPLVDVSGDYNTEAPRKNWERAYTTLERLMNKQTTE